MRKQSCACANNNSVRELESDRQTTNELVGIFDLLPGSQLLFDVAVHVVSGGMVSNDDLVVYVIALMAYAFISSIVNTFFSSSTL